MKMDIVTYGQYTFSLYIKFSYTNTFNNAKVLDPPVNPFVWLCNDSLDAEEEGSLGGPVAGGAAAVVLARQDDHLVARGQVLLMNEYYERWSVGLLVVTFFRCGTFLLLISFHTPSSSLTHSSVFIAMINYFKLIFYGTDLFWTVITSTITAIIMRFPSSLNEW